MRYDERRNWELYWLVDPLDGTVEFIKGNNEFTVNIALMENNVCIGAVIYVPYYREDVHCRVATRGLTSRSGCGARCRVRTTPTRRS